MTNIDNIEELMKQGWISEQEYLTKLGNILIDEYENHYSVERLKKPHFLTIHTTEELTEALKYLTSFSKITIIRNELESRGVI